MTQLIKWNEARRAIAAAHAIDEIKNIRDWAEATRYALIQAKEAPETIRQAEEIKLRAERRAGEKLKEIDLQKPGEYQRSEATTVAPSLKDMGVTKDQSSHWQRIANIPEEKFEEFIADAKEITTSGALRIADTPHVTKSTGENEWYTPSYIIKSARNTMGNICLDPASSDLANEIVGADVYYTKETNGLNKDWVGNVWMNPPYSQPLISEFSQKIIADLPYIEQACVLVNNATETRWLQNMMLKCDAICFLSGRIKFIDTKGSASGAPLQGQVILYFGEDADKFNKEFSNHGICMERMKKEEQ